MTQNAERWLEIADELTKIAQDSARGSFFLGFGGALSTVILAIASILIARYLGSELYGQYALALVVPQILFLLTDLGISQGITKFASALKSKGEFGRVYSIVKHGFLVRACMGFVIFSVNFFFADLIAVVLLQRPELAFLVRIASMAIIFQVVFATATAVFVGLDKTEYQAITANVQATTKAIISIALILTGLGITGALIGYTASYGVTALTAVPLLWLVLRKKITPSDDGNLRNNLNMLFQYGTPLYISGLLAGVLPLFKNVILAFFVTDSDIGNYKAALNFVAILVVLASPITTMLLPAFSKLNQKTKQKIGEFFQISVKYTAIIVLPVAFLIMLFSSEIVSIIYGEAFVSAPLFLSSYTLIYLLVGVGYLTLPSLFNGVGETRITMKMWIIRFVILVLLVVPLTQAYGVQGLIVAFLIAMALGTFYGAYEATNKLQIKYDLKSTVKIYFAAAVSGVVPLFLSNVMKLPAAVILSLGGILYLGSYITLLPLTNVVTESELRKTELAIKNTPILKQIVKPILHYQQRLFRRKARFEKTMRP